MEPHISVRRTATGVFLCALCVLLPGTIHAQNPDLWRFVASGEILTPLVVHDSGGISFISDDGNLYRVHEYGIRQWRRRLTEPPSGEIAGLHDGSVVFGLESGAVKRVGPAGAVAWRLSPAETPLSSISASNLGVIYLAYESGGLRAINYAGRSLWAVSVGSDFAHGPILGTEGQVYLVTEGQELLQLSPDGHTEISYELERVPVQAAIRPDNTLVFGYEDGSIEVVDAQTDTETLIAQVPSAPQQLFVDADGTVSALDSDGHLWRISDDPEPADGYTVYTVAEGVVRAGATGAGEYIVTDADALVRRIDSSGEVRMTIRPGFLQGSAESISAPVMGRSGHVAFTDSQWALWAFSGQNIAGRSWLGEASNGLRNSRIAELHPLSRSDLRDITEYRVLSSLVSEGGLRESERVLEEIESALDRGDLRGQSSWISHLLMNLAGHAAGGPDSGNSTRGSRRVTSEIASRAYAALGRVGDRVALQALHHAALRVDDVTRLESVMAALGETGYDLDVSRDIIIQRAYRRAGGPGAHAGLDTAYIRAIETLWEQGVRLSPDVVSQIAALQESGANGRIRGEAGDLLTRMIFDGASRMFDVLFE